MNLPLNFSFPQIYIEMEKQGFFDIANFSKPIMLHPLKKHYSSKFLIFPHKAIFTLNKEVLIR